MVERVRITPSQIVTRDAGGSITFNTDYSYLKTGSGTLYAGGYQRAPAIYGTADGSTVIVDHNSYGEGWYTSEIKTGSSSFYPTSTGTYQWSVPKATDISWLYLPGAGTSLGRTFVSSNVRWAQYYSYDTFSYSNSGVRYQWAISDFGYDPYTDNYGTSYGRSQWEIYPLFTSTNFPAITNPNGGAISLEYSANEYGDYYRTVTTTDPYGYTRTYNDYGLNYYTARTGISYDEGGSGTVYNIPASPIYWRPGGFFTKKAPVALSLAVTV